jgi:hypothetical protein
MTTEYKHGMGKHKYDIDLNLEYAPMMEVSPFSEPPGEMAGP